MFSLTHMQHILTNRSSEGASMPRRAALRASLRAFSPGRKMRTLPSAPRKALSPSKQELP